MKNDTLKSLAFLKKSIKMNQKAIMNNETTLGQSVSNDISAFFAHGTAMLSQIDTWEKDTANAANTLAIDPSTVSPNTINTNTNDVDDDDSNLLTVP